MIGNLLFGTSIISLAIDLNNLFHEKPLSRYLQDAKRSNKICRKMFMFKIPSFSSNSQDHLPLLVQH